MVLKLRKKVKPKDIVQLLLNHGSLTLPKIAELLDANVGSIDYHLKRLEEKGFVKVKRKSYGSKYYIPDELISLIWKTVWEFAFSFVGLFLSVYLLLGDFNPFYLALVISTGISFLSSLYRLGVEKSMKKRQLLEKVSLF